MKKIVLLLSIVLLSFNGYSTNPLTVDGSCFITPPIGYASAVEVTTNLDPLISSHYGVPCGSLRWAILYANSNPDATYIKFNIPTGTSKEIVISTLLPHITSQVYIDGTSQLGYNSVTKVPVVTIKCGLPDPTWAYDMGTALHFWQNSDNSIVKGIYFTKFWAVYIMIGGNEGVGGGWGQSNLVSPVTTDIKNILIQDNVFGTKSNVTPCGGNPTNCNAGYALGQNIYWSDVHFTGNASYCSFYGNYFGFDIQNNVIVNIADVSPYGHGIYCDESTQPNLVNAPITTKRITNITIGSNDNINRNYFTYGNSLATIRFANCYSGANNGGYNSNVNSSIVRNNIFVFNLINQSDIPNKPPFISFGNQNQNYEQNYNDNSDGICLANGPNISYQLMNTLYGTAKPKTLIEIYKLVYDPIFLKNTLIPVGLTTSNRNGYWSISSNALYVPAATYTSGDKYVVLSHGGGYNSNTSSFSDFFTVDACPTISISGAPFIACRTGGTIALTGTPAGGSFYGAGMTNNVFDPASLPTTTTSSYIGYTYNTVPAGCPTTANVQINVPPAAQPLTNVINISAASYNDAWPSDAMVVQNQTKPYYMVGVKGLWIPEETYAYVDERAQSAVTALTVRTDGLLQNVPMFNWNYTTNGDCYPNWRKVNTVTQLANGTGQLENKDILNIYSSALYGYNDQLTIATASNAELHEICFEGFEEYDAGQTLNLNNISKGNFTVVTSVPVTDDLDRNIYFNYDIIQGFNNEIIINYPASRAGELYGKLVQIYGAEISNNTNKLLHGNYTVYKVTAGQDANTCKIVLNSSEFTFYGSWLGKVAIPIDISSDITPVFQVNSNSVSVVNTIATDLSRKAHTGKKFVRIDNNVEFEQIKMKLIPGAKYVFSTWVSSDAVNASTYHLAGRGVSINFIDASGQKITTSSVNFDLNATQTGDIIEGWQRLQGEFICPVNAVRFTVSLLTPTSLATYFDDIRIFPSDGNMQTFVFNNTNYKLSAVLDPNNYATYYFYDEGGSLYLIKKETERGILTLQETVTHITEINK